MGPVRSPRRAIAAIACLVVLLPSVGAEPNGHEPLGELSWAGTGPAAAARAGEVALASGSLVGTSAAPRATPMPPPPSSSPLTGTGRFQVNATIELPSGSTASGNVLDRPNVAEPVDVAYDAASDRLYVAGYISSQVGDFAVGNGSLLGGIPTEPLTDGLAVDPALGRLYVGNWGDYPVLVVSTGNDTVVGQIAAGYSPSALVYDSGTGETFVANANSQNVSVISDASGAVVSTIPVGATPEALAYASSSGEIFVANYNSQNLTVINDSTDTVVASVTLSGYPQAVAYDPTDDRVFVTLQSPDSVAILSAATNQVLGNVSAGSVPEGIAFDNATDQIFVSNYFSGNLTVIDGSNGTSAFSVPIGYYPGSLAFDGRSSTLFVALPYRNLLVGVSGVTDQVVSTSPTGASPASLALGTASGQLYVGDAFSDVVTALDPANGTIRARFSVGEAPSSIADDGGRGELFVAIDSAFNFTVVNESTDATVASAATAGLGPFGLVYDPALSEIDYISGFSGSVGFSLEVVAMNDTTYTNAAPITASGEAWALAYDAGTQQLFTANYGSGNVSVISPSTGRVVANIDVGVGPQGIAYDPGRNEVFVANSISDTVSVISDAADTVVATVPVGSSPISMAYDSYGGEMLVVNGGTNGALGTVSAISDATNAVTSTTSVGAAAGQIVYDPVTNLAYVANLATGTISVLGENLTPLSAELSVATTPSSCGPLQVDGNSTPSGAVLLLTEGSHTIAARSCPGFAFSYWNAGGSVALGSATNRTTTFDLTGLAAITAEYYALPSPTYRVTFTEQGLPSGTSWSVSLGTDSNRSTLTSLGFSDPNGTYAYAIGAVSGFVANRSNGFVVVDGQPQAVGVQYQPNVAPPRLYQVAFVETGLPTGTNWSVTLAGALLSSGSDRLAFPEANGSYPFVVGAVLGYGPAPAEGTVAVTGANVSVAIHFAPTPGPGGVVAGGPTSGALALGVGAALVVAVLAVVVLLYRRRNSSSRRPPNEAPAPRLPP